MRNDKNKLWRHNEHSIVPKQNTVNMINMAFKTFGVIHFSEGT